MSKLKNKMIVADRSTNLLVCQQQSIESNKYEISRMTIYY